MGGMGSVLEERRCGAGGRDEEETLVKEEAVEGANGKDLSVPVVQNPAVGAWQRGGWKAFHAGAQ